MSPASPAEAVVEHGEVRISGAPPSGIYQIGSVTKVFTGLLLAREVVDGRLALDTPLAQLVTDLAGSDAGRLTLGELVSHTSGLPRLPPGLWRKILSPRARRDPYADIDGARLVAGLRRLEVRPTDRPAYSNLGFGLLGYALATHLGTTFDGAVRHRITEPLGLADTGVRPRDPARVVVGTTRRGKPHPVAWSFDALAGAGALWSTVDDLVAFLRVQLTPPDDSLGEAVRLCQRTIVRQGAVEYAMAWIRLSGRREDDGSLLWHNGGTAGYRSFVGVDHGRERAVVVLGSSDRSVDRRGMELARTRISDPQAAPRRRPRSRRGRPPA